MAKLNLGDGLVYRQLRDGTWDGPFVLKSTWHRGDMQLCKLLNPETGITITDVEYSYIKPAVEVRLLLAISPQEGL